MIVPLADWYTPLGICEEEDDPLPFLAPFYCCLVEAIVPLAATDMLTARAWQWAKEMLDQKPRPKGLIEWTSRWRNFLAMCWHAVDEHLDRLGRIERAHAKKKKLVSPQGELEMSPAPPPPTVTLEL